MFDEDADTDIIMDFDQGIDSIEFLIESFGYDELDVLREPQATKPNGDGGSAMLIDVNALGLDASSFEFASTPKASFSRPHE